MSEWIVAALLPFAVLVGVALGWSSRAHSRWCEDCGRTMICPSSECVERRAIGCRWTHATQQQTAATTLPAKQVTA
jgi:hypothetical protein